MHFGKNFFTVKKIEPQVVVCVNEPFEFIYILWQY